MGNEGKSTDDNFIRETENSVMKIREESTIKQSPIMAKTKAKTSNQAVHNPRYQ